MDHYNEQYIDTLEQQIELRPKNPGEVSSRITLDENWVKKILRSENQNSEDDLAYFAANDFCHIRAFVPESVDADLIMEKLLESLHNQKWDANDDDLQGLHTRILDKDGNKDRGIIHKGLPAAYDGNSVRYDITEGHEGPYNFVTIRQVVGLVDWCKNSYQSEGLTVYY